MRHNHRAFRALLLAVLTLFATALLASCGGGEGHDTGHDENSSDQDALSVIREATTTMFSWEPGKDASSGDAYDRAKPYLTDKLARLGGERTERGPGAQWDGWAAVDAKVEATVLIIGTDHAPDTVSKVSREVDITQTVSKPNGDVIDTMQLTAFVTAVKVPDRGWLVDELEIA